MAAAVAVSIARASLRGGLLRPDPTAVPIDEISSFHALLDKALTICSPANIQNCKRWILKNVGPSRARVVLLGKYLAALSPSLSASTKASPRRQRLHILYLINDILHHTTHHERSPTFPEEIKPFLRDLFSSAVSPGAVKQLAKLERLLKLWLDRDYYPTPFITELLTTTRDAAAGVKNASTNSGIKKHVTGRPLLLPPFHGDPSLPFYDLPAANILPHLVPNSPIPINPRLVKPIQFSTLTPNETLAVAVKDFLSSVEGIFSPVDTNIDADPDAVGGLAGANGEGYYGWSRSFCEKMKMKRRAALEEKTGGRDRDRGRSDARSRGRSYSSDGGSSSRRSYSQSHSRSRSHSRRRYRSSRSRSPSSRSRSPARASFQQGQPQPLVSQPQPQQTQHYPPDQHYPNPNQGFPPVPPPPMQYGYPAHNQQYPWPPPPPPPPGFHAMMAQQAGFAGYGYVQGYGQSQPQQQQPQQQQQQGPWNQQSGGGGYPPQYGSPAAQGGQGGQVGQGQSGQSGQDGSAGFDDYRSIKGREIGAKRGWKT